jgi:hypothetical protein
MNKTIKMIKKILEGTLGKKDRKDEVKSLKIILSVIFIFLLLFVVAPKMFTSAEEKTEIQNAARIKSAIKQAKKVKAEDVISFSENAMLDSFDFSFYNYEAKLETVKANFTASGWEMFMETLSSQRHIEEVVRNRQTVTVGVISAGVILSEGESEDGYKWDVEVPIKMNIENTSYVASKSVMVRMTIDSTPQEESIFSISNIDISPYRANKEQKGNLSHL